MRRGQLLTLFILHLLQLLLLFCGTRAETVTEDPITEFVCKFVNCGQGQCKAANGTLFPFDCECKPGWKKVVIGPITLPPCVLPNCTINFDCGSVSPPPPPPAPLLPTLINDSDPCTYTSCGDGSCVRTEGPGYICKCNEGSANLLNMSGLACVKQCSLGANCSKLDIGPFDTGSPPPSFSDAPNSRKDGWPKGDGSFARDQPVLAILLLLATFIPWI